MFLKLCKTAGRSAPALVGVLDECGAWNWAGMSGRGVYPSPHFSARGSGRYQDAYSSEDSERWGFWR